MAAVFFPESATVPEAVATDKFLVRPLRVADVEADYEALMESREMLREWDQSDWPADDFTLDENRADLEEHESDHAARRAFTYTVMSPDESRCLGCVYIHPLGPILGHLGAPEDELAGVGDGEAYVTFWVRESELAGGLERRLLTTLVDWLDADWPFGRVVFGTNSDDSRQVSLLEECGFKERWRYPVEGRQSSYLLYVR